ncbi:MAG: YgjP-like metallopeptidase domain-containing protein [Mucinivorans sp.]
MGLFRYIFSPRPTATPISSVRRKIWFVGIQYSIKIEAGSRNSSRIEGAVLHLTLKEMTRENFEAYLASWYRRASRGVFQKSIDMWLVRMELMGYFVDAPRIKVFEMSRAWGRCYYTKGLITFNAHLARMPSQCIDYITLHELCHFLINCHNSDFYGIMTRLDPRWRQWEDELKVAARVQGLTR